MKNNRSYFEFHVTIKGDTISPFLFKETIESLGLKPIIIDTQNGEYQYMTSSVHKLEQYKPKLIEIVSVLRSAGFHVIRQKVEKKPEPFKDPEFIYYESHLRLKLSLDYDLNLIALFCKKYNFHMSKNLFKRDLTEKYQMITYRSTEILDLFLKHIKSAEKALLKNNIYYDKIEIEECIFDSNISVDQKWLELSY